MTTLAKDPPAQQAHRQIIANAESALVGLNVERQTLQSQIQAAQAEQTHIQTHASTRDARLTQARRNAEDARIARDTAQAHAQLAHGTPLSSESGETLRQRIEQCKLAEQERDQLQAVHEREQAQEMPQLMELAQRQQEWQARLTAIATEQANIEHAKEQAFVALGEAEHQDTLSNLVAADGNIAELEKQLEAARAARQAIIHEGLQRLSQWPGYQPELLSLLPLDDAVTRILEAEMAYIDRLLTDGRQLPMRISRLPALEETGGQIDPLLELPGHFFHTLETLRGNPTGLKRRRQVLGSVVSQYKAKVHGEGRR